MANPYHHAVSSSRKFGGVPEDYLAIHEWFDESKSLMADPRHRALRHHAFGISEAIRVFGSTIALSTCRRCGELEREHFEFGDENLHVFEAKLVPTRYVGEQHVREDLGYIPKATDWLELIEPKPWMMNARRLSRELEVEESSLTHSASGQ